MNEKPPAPRPDFYEFHIAGTVGPLARAAIPGFSTVTVPRYTVLTGTVRCRADLQRLLDALDAHDTPAIDVRVTRRDPAASSPDPIGVAQA